MSFLQDLREKRRKKLLDEYIQKTALTEQEKLKYQRLKQQIDEKEALKKKKQELKKYRKKVGELRYGKYKAFLKKHWKITAKIIIVLVVIWLIFTLLRT